METLMEDEVYNFTEIELPSRLPVQHEQTGDQSRTGRDILIAVDHGPKSKHAFDWAMSHFCHGNDTVHLIHAVSSLSNTIVYEAANGLMEKLAVEAFRVAMSPRCQIQKAFAFESKLALLLINMDSKSKVWCIRGTYMRTVNLSDLSQKVKTSARIAEGDPGKVICKEAERLKPVAVVMGTRGRSLIQSVLQGSVSEYCFHNCKVAPVIIVPGNATFE